MYDLTDPRNGQLEAHFPQVAVNHADAGLRRSIRCTCGWASRSHTLQSESVHEWAVHTLEMTDSLQRYLSEGDGIGEELVKMAEDAEDYSDEGDPLFDGADEDERGARISKLLQQKTEVESNLIALEAQVGRAHMAEVDHIGRELFACEDARIALRRARLALIGYNQQLANEYTRMRMGDAQQ